MKALRDEAKGRVCTFVSKFFCHSLLDMLLAETGGSVPHAGYMAKALKNVWD
jgi:hypothetical protein